MSHIIGRIIGKYKWNNGNAHDGAADCIATLHCYKSILKLRG